MATNPASIGTTGGGQLPPRRQGARTTGSQRTPLVLAAGVISIESPLAWLDRSRWVLTLSSVLLAAALAASAFLRRSFVPAFNEGTLTLSGATAPVRSLAKTNQPGADLSPFRL